MVCRAILYRTNDAKNRHPAADNQLEGENIQKNCIKCVFERISCICCVHVHARNKWVCRTSKFFINAII